MSLGSAPLNTNSASQFSSDFNVKMEATRKEGDAFIHTVKATLSNGMAVTITHRSSAIKDTKAMTLIAKQMILAAETMKSLDKGFQVKRDAQANFAEYDPKAHKIIGKKVTLESFKETYQNAKPEVNVKIRNLANHLLFNKPDKAAPTSTKQAPVTSPDTPAPQPTSSKAKPSRPPPSPKGTSRSNIPNAPPPPPVYNRYAQKEASPGVRPNKGVPKEPTPPEDEKEMSLQQ